MDFYNYDAEDFALLESFRKWILQPDRESNIFWSEWLENNPEKLDVIESARKIVENMPAAHHQLTDQEILDITAGIEDAIANDAASAPLPTNNRIIPINAHATTDAMAGKQKTSHKKWLAYAAAILAIIGGVYFFEFYFESPITSTDRYITMETPRGQKSQINLPDGSMIWLNAGSSVKYLEHFSEESRQIHLEGEAYFEVARDARRPFTVFAGGLATTALGTSFNISSYPGDSLIDVELLTGKVQVEQSGNNKSEPLILTPGLGARLNTSSEQFELTSFEMARALLWKNGIIEFENASFAEIEKTLERWYAIEIKCQNKSKHNWSYNGRFEDESLELVLRKISLTEDFDYTIEKNNVEISFNR